MIASELGRAVPRQPGGGTPPREGKLEQPREGGAYGAASGQKPQESRGNYTRESGIGVDMVMKKPLSMFATAPQFFGREGEVVLGKKSGKASITYQLEKFGIENVSDEQIAEILAEVKTRGAEKKSLLTDDEFKEIVSQKIG